jgi:hypothetical protein
MIAPEEAALRRRQAIGVVWIALAVVLYCAIHAGWHSIFLNRWWNLF